MKNQWAQQRRNNNYKETIKKSTKNKGDFWDLLKASWRFQAGEFFNKSTLHGVRYIAEKGRPFSERFMWFCLTSIGTIVTLIIITSLWEKFQTNPTITGLDTDFHNWDVPFPTVTLCPSDPTNASQVLNYVDTTFGQISLDKIDYYIDYVNTISLLSINNLENIFKFSGDGRDKKLPSTNFIDLIYKVVEECPNVIFDCQWKGSSYNCCEGFYPILTEVGFCYTFNSMFSRRKSEELRVELKDGEFKPQQIYETDYKWSIVVNMQNVTDTNVYIHSADELPREGLVPQHKWRGTIGKIDFSEEHTYSTEEVQSLSINQRHCVFPREIKLLSNTNYTYSMCMIECRMKKAKALCGCVPFFYKEYVGFPHCDLKGLECLARHRVELKEKLRCSCHLGCMNTVYQVVKLTDAGEENFNSLEIGFVSWPMIRYKREVLFGLVDLLVSCGGIAGLFLGFSLLSGVEIIYYFTMRACCMLHHGRRELRQLYHKHKTQPRPDFNFSLKPYFLKDIKVTPSKHIKVKERIEHLNIPFVN